MKSIYGLRSRSWVFGSAVFGLLFPLFGCESYKEVDFQADRCKQAPSGSIKATEKGRMRWDFEVEGADTDVERESFRTVWTIGGVSYVARKISYQFEGTGEQKIAVILTNRCFMQTTKETTITVK
ncbi:hypothetical protein LZD49_31650 [Dyadobacter sp. CY261]|uniref:hypothetical protein n=1 Tax=Dyadobacter sp. CY261 TaxID=2907203 RepID=UPI001F1A520E|nr:hypothetical protein [Dyadobacter sp. CY261]MCF0075082.1 hypothetical protein [Dyadobacter sp. CY261]